jgi:hypothetical protein
LEYGQSELLGAYEDYMSTSDTQDLDLRIQFSLVRRIRHAANAYNAAPASSSSEAFETYLSGLESLANYVAAKWRGERVVLDISTATHRLRASHRTSVKHECAARIIPFGRASGGTGNSTPLTAA